MRPDGLQIVEPPPHLGLFLVDGELGDGGLFGGEPAQDVAIVG
jgi:hypothetical protein